MHDAAGRAAAERADRVRIEHLAPSAGLAVPPPSSRRAERVRAYVRHGERLSREDIERALATHDGNVSQAAKSLGLQRTQLYRELERHSIDRPDRDRGDPRDKN
jgi:transcriptional regulator of acetoin/glycerol metabolism